MTAQILARCVHGLEWVVAEEISRRVPAVRRLDLARREVTFSLPAVDRALLDLRTVDDVFVSIGTIGGIGTTKASLPLLGGSLADLPVAGWVDAVRTIRPLADPPLFDV
ncbi:MAG: hypothetical protein JXA67_12425, partial [Micromonosporaceae bacterium]|nr:hypothetical protein [Micromonosporaceae bacterium]